ncbi:flagellar biosynthesis protein FlhB [Calycomorphotria hydatis]|uniref:Flagellar biosynthetic protein FlhB n=1 Tax=Calycomorphotria hydatis TaxID=2528027 RepID=A0A517TB82_9PLAN|nr:flagellar biosynthesis protein FlhB [Calycomorphotria hydatis]QDT65633.1 Flagellar biosynthetic protein FlhB [Calycomorphotria hydatis]
MADDTGDKTEEPTERRRQEQREKGNVARSQDLAAAGLMLAVAVALMTFGVPLASDMADLMAAMLSHTHLQLLPSTVHEGAWQLTSTVATAVLPVLLLMAAASVGINLVQVGFLFSPSALQPKPERLNPVQGLQRIFSIASLMRLGTSLGKLIILVIVAGLMMWWTLPQMTLLSNAVPADTFEFLHSIAVQLAFALAAALVILALLDFAFQRWKFEQDIRMTKQEVRDEMKNMEGDPHIRQRRKEAHRKLAEARDMAQVPGADVIVTNPTHYSVAIKYDPEKMAAPIVVAKGVEELAFRIRRIAAEHDVPIIERPALARALYRDVNVGHPVPVDMYEALVEVMAYVYRLTGRRPPNLF